MKKELVYMLAGAATASCWFLALSNKDSPVTLLVIPAIAGSVFFLFLFALDTVDNWDK